MFYSPTIGLSSYNQNMNGFKAVGFDYGGVIGGYGFDGEKFAVEMSQAIGISVEEYKKRYYEINSLANTGEVNNTEDFWRLYLEKLGKLEKLSKVLEITRKSEKLLENIDERLIKLVDKIRKKGYKTALLSNNSERNGGKMRHMGLDHHFDVFHISAETGFMKPQVEAFELLCRQLKISPEQLIFVDDSSMSLSSSTLLGFTPILYKGYDELVLDLINLGIIDKD